MKLPLKYKIRPAGDQFQVLEIANGKRSRAWYGTWNECVAIWRAALGI